MKKPTEQVTRRNLLGLFCAGAGASLLHGCSDPSHGVRPHGGLPEAGHGHDSGEGLDSGMRDAGDGSDGVPREDGSEPSCAPTTSDVEGPYYAKGAPSRTLIAAKSEPGDRLVISGTVFGPDCTTPLSGAVVDVWQADKDGSYHGADEEYRLRGQMKTGKDGHYEFETIRPGQYALSGGFRPAHIHFMVAHPGHRPLTTQLYFKGDRYLPPNDACGPGCKSNDPDRIIELQDGVLMHGKFDIVLGIA